MKKRIWEALVIVICTIGIIACNQEDTGEAMENVSE